jgi:predicted Zn-ribbon and HTH transcriptional regulator
VLAQILGIFKSFLKMTSFHFDFAFLLLALTLFVHGNNEIKIKKFRQELEAKNDEILNQLEVTTKVSKNNIVLFMRLRPSVCQSVGWSVRASVPILLTSKLLRSRRTRAWFVIQLVFYSLTSLKSYFIKNSRGRRLKSFPVRLIGGV